MTIKLTMGLFTDGLFYGSEILSVGDDEIDDNFVAISLKQIVEDYNDLKQDLPEEYAEEDIILGIEIVNE